MDKLMGTGVALVTPFKNDFSVDTEALANIVEHCIEGGIDYLVALGTTAETATLTPAEKQLVVKTIVQTNAGRLPLVIGIGGNNTSAVIESIKQQDLDGFDAILSVSPYYNKPTQEGIYQHFKAIAENSPLPLIVYNVPGRTGSNILPATVLRLANDFDNIIAIKEASGDMTQVMEIIKDKPKDFMVISGDDMTALSTVLAGGSGVISVLAQGVPNDFSKMISLGLQAKVKEAFDLQYAVQDGVGLIFEEGNPAGIKAVFETLGLATGIVRLPLVPATEGLKRKISQFMKPFVRLHA
ncbi:4-hydroxy-tetrahydrodipicolinate synthase [Maribacter sp. ANRC-HE7]|uniref:4-hydroxy-tetrahydrodipicolinate synthase n=1 Tax=Maribacter aquimaris TaxID=2737171 RepID=A0ABR7UVP9_9FLAO|nr:4-hydroxy-tetrahydrodipicolinate synthase [Maribacter aquimaris]MBD0776544.1 4-hydroxy-tetrahydrodipicolinate synthase [Maribacter aquimaris]